jgi:hypothetical protein
LLLSKQGTWTVGTDGDLETPLDNKDCAYVILMAKPLCVDRASLQSRIIDWKTGFLSFVSNTCKDFTEFAAVNYDKWDICDPPVP